jgi:hypothetical protein
MNSLKLIGEIIIGTAIGHYLTSMGLLYTGRYRNRKARKEYFDKLDDLKGQLAHVMGHREEKADDD